MGTEEPVVVGMEAIVTQLTTGITSETLFSVVGDVMPFVIVMITFAFAWHVLRRTVKGASRGRASI